MDDPDTDGPDIRSAGEDRPMNATVDFGTVAGDLDTALAIWDRGDRLRWANRRFRALIPSLAPTVVPGLPFESWLYRAVDANAVASARSDRIGWLARCAAAHREPGPAFEVELSPGAWFRVRETRLDSGVLSCWTDIGDLKRSREALAASEARYRGLVEMAADVVMALDDRRIVFINRRGASVSAPPARRRWRANRSPPSFLATVTTCAAAHYRRRVPSSCSAGWTARRCPWKCGGCGSATANER